ncbi:MAG: DivIVA domain-containing protein [Clostridia bacterium]|nr:DivIVA domain-containing protein [Clostridia bacterium]
MLTPIDIDNKVFKKTKLGGYDVKDVENFLLIVMGDYEKLYKENAELRDKVNAMQESVSYYKSIEEGIKQTVENAQASADDIKETAKRDAESIRKEAEIDSKRKLEDLQKQIIRAEADYEDKKKQMQIYKIRVTSMLEAQLKILNEDKDL